MINIQKAFIAYISGSVQYDGRAYSELDDGNYVLIYKSDGSFQIHTTTKITPINYQKAGSSIHISGNVLIVSNRKETIKVMINTVHSVVYPGDWSDTKLKLFKTEKELVDKITENWNVYVSEPVNKITKEYKTSLGPIDIAGETDEILVLIEVKRNSITANNIYQLKKYIENIDDSRIIIPNIAGPSIKDNAMEICIKNNIKYIEVKF